MSTSLITEWGLMAMSKRIIAPQKGAQERFLASRAQICIYGGAAGGGKTCGMLIDALRWKDREGYGAVFFRKNHNQIFSQGGLWDEGMKLYSGIARAYPQLGRSRWVFRGSDGHEVSKISFAHIEREQDVHKWQGSQICGLYFDELTHFSEKTFFYMLSRNRSTCGVTPYVRASCNPDADSWVAKFISWWIDPDTGYPIKERSGVIRWMLRREDQLYWADTKEELIEQFKLESPEELNEPKSVTFIASTIYDNQILLKTNPSYLANLKALPLVERERLLQGNWKIKPAAGLYGSVHRNTFSRPDFYNFSYRNRFGINPDRLSVPDNPCSVRAQFHERLYGTAGFANRIILKKFPYLVEQHNSGGFGIFSDYKCTGGCNRH